MLLEVLQEMAQELHDKIHHSTTAVEDAAGKVEQARRDLQQAEQDESDTNRVYETMKEKYKVLNEYCGQLGGRPEVFTHKLTQLSREQGIAERKRDDAQDLVEQRKRELQGCITPLQTRQEEHRKLESQL